MTITTQLQQEGKIEEWVLEWYWQDPEEMKKKDYPLYLYAQYWAWRIR